MSIWMSKKNVALKKSKMFKILAMHGTGQGVRLYLLFLGFASFLAGLGRPLAAHGCSEHEVLEKRARKTRINLTF